MDAKQVFVKTPAGDEAVRQSTRVVQRNLRMVLVQVDGKLSVGELSAKIGNQRLVESALNDLREGGFIAPKQGGVLVREPSMPPLPALDRVSAISQFSTFGSRPPQEANPVVPPRMASQFSTFGKPILPASGQPGQAAAALPRRRERAPRDMPEPGVVSFPLRWLLGVPLGLILLLLLLVLLYPYNKLKPDIEAASSRLLQTPVHIGDVTLALWPRPAMVLTAVRIGESQDATIEELRIASPWSLLGSGHRPLSGVDALGASVPADFLVTSPLFQASPRLDDNGPAIRLLRFERLKISARDLALHDLSGEVAFGSDGRVERAAFQNIELGIRLQATPTAAGILLNIEGFGWKPLGANLAFGSLQAKGLLQKGKLVIQSLDTTFLNGILTGSWLLDWSGNGLLMAGDGTLLRLDCRKLSAALSPVLKLEGELAGALRLRASGHDWDSLWGNVEASLDADITHGILHGVDLGEVVRSGAGFVARSGTTKFDRLRTVLSISPQQVRGRDIQMTAGMVTASGQFVVGRQHALDANLLVTMQTSVSTVRTPVHLTGTLPEMSAVAGK